MTEELSRSSGHHRPWRMPPMDPHNGVAH
jgi:hypothetical protein